MSMYSTQYQNPTRIVTGTPTLTNSDVVLYCDTTSSPVILNLLDIPNNYWQTTWKLYVIDYSNNAATNNITINAGSGQTINGQSSLVISTNGGEAFVRIQSNTSFLGILAQTGTPATNIDTGWVDLLGFDFYPVSITKPQARRINNQILFRGTVYIPLSSNSGSTLVPLTSATAYQNQPYNQVYSGSGGCTINSLGSISFNNDASVIPSSIIPTSDSFDGTYSKQQVASRAIEVSGNAGMSLTSFISCIITNDKRLVFQVNHDIEDIPVTSPDLVGSIPLRFITSNVKTGQYIPNYLNLSSEIQGFAVSGLQPLRTETDFPLSGGNHTYLFDCDASDENQIGGFVARLDGLSAYIAP